MALNTKGNNVREFYSKLPRRCVWGSSHWIDAVVCEPKPRPVEPGDGQRTIASVALAPYAAYSAERVAGDVRKFGRRSKS